MNIHPLANLLPDMTETEFAGLCESVRANGLREPILTVSGPDGVVILDGRNRYRACQAVGVEPRYVPYEGADDEETLLNLILDRNLHRRHLNDGQRAMLAARVANLSKGRPKKNASIEAFTQTRNAQKFKVGRSAVQRAAVVIERGLPALQETVDEGDVPVSVAEKVARMPEREQVKFVYEVGRKQRPPHQVLAVMRRDAQRQAIIGKSVAPPQGIAGRRFPVVLADPPYRYEVTPMGHTARSIENHYPTMPLTEICALPVRNVVMDDAVLFLWVPSPQDAAGHNVLNAWGFTYRSKLIWDKDRIGMGDYFRQQHEELWLGTRGNLPLPEPDTRPPSVFRSARTEHSRKPDEIYAMIAAMYPGLPALELFARPGAERDGWLRLGNEITGRDIMTDLLDLAGCAEEDEE
jgi:N6-adenosine-specific RNA methylase IME4